MAINLLSARLSTYLSSERAAIEACEEEEEAEGKQGEAIKAAIKLSALLPPSLLLPPFLPFLPSCFMHIIIAAERSGLDVDDAAACACSRGFSRLLNFSPLLDLDGPLVVKFGRGCVISPEHYTKLTRVDLSSARM